MGRRRVLKNLVWMAVASCVAGAPFAARAVALSGVSGTAAQGPALVSEKFVRVNDEESDQTGKGAMAFISSMGQQAIGFLADQSLTPDQKRISFGKLLQDSFDMRTIGRFSLGRYWRVASPAQRKEYQSLFENMIINVYSQRFSDYEGQRFETRGFRSAGANDAIVTSFIVPDTGPEVQVDWRVRYKNGRYRVIDVIVEGVSMSVTQRSDFSSVIQRGGGDVQVLLNHLRSL